MQWFESKLNFIYIYIANKLTKRKSFRSMMVARHLFNNTFWVWEISCCFCFTVHFNHSLWLFVLYFSYMRQVLTGQILCAENKADPVFIWLNWMMLCSSWFPRIKCLKCLIWSDKLQNSFPAEYSYQAIIKCHILNPVSCFFLILFY